MSNDCVGRSWVTILVTEVSVGIHGIVSVSTGGRRIGVVEGDAAILM